MSTITAKQSAGWAATVVVTLSGSDSIGSTSYSVLRRVNGAESPVAGATGVPLRNGVWDDAEAPLGVPVTYRLLFSTNQVVDSTPIVLSSSDGQGRDLPVLSDPYRGLAAQVWILASDRKETHGSRATLVQVEGRADPVVIWDVEQAAQLPELRMLTTTVEAARTVETIAASGDPVLLRAPCQTVPDRWLQRAGDRTSEAFSETSRSATRVHSWSTMQVLPGLWRPGVRFAGDTLADVDAAVGSTTLQAIADQWQTLLEIAADDLRAR